MNSSYIYGAEEKLKKNKDHWTSDQNTTLFGKEIKTTNKKPTSIINEQVLVTNKESKKGSDNGRKDEETTRQDQIRMVIQILFHFLITVSVNGPNKHTSTHFCWITHREPDMNLKQAVWYIWSLRMTDTKSFIICHRYTIPLDIK